MGSALGAVRVAAVRLGLSFGEYQARLSEGLKWCGGCKAWHERAAFGVDRTRGDGLAAQCLSALKKTRGAAYKPRQRRSKLGARFVPSRDGDKIQARARANQAVRTGVLPRPGALPCADCGHVSGEGEARHEYDHHLGYSAEHQLSVQAVCVPCHRARDQKRRANG